MSTKTSEKKESRQPSRKPHEMVLGECREEKAAYVKVREAKMMTLCDKVKERKKQYGKRFGTTNDIIQQYNCNTIAIQCNAIPHSTEQHSIVQYSTTQYSTVQCSAV